MGSLPMLVIMKSRDTVPSGRSSPVGILAQAERAGLLSDRDWQNPGTGHDPAEVAELGLWHLLFVALERTR